ncbi:MAG: hypothetical protein AAGC77_05420 [Pseudomonadota bacterium]
MEETAQAIVLGLGVYFAIGVVVALLFLVFFVGRLDKAASGASLFFRPMIFPGCVVLWPFVVGRILSFRTINTPTETDQ